MKLMPLPVLLLLAACAHESPFSPTPQAPAAPAPPATIAVEPVFLAAPPPPTTQPPAPRPEPPAPPGDVYHFCDHPFFDWQIVERVWPDWTALTAIPLWDEAPQDVPHIVHGTQVLEACRAERVGTPAWTFTPDVQGSPPAEAHHGNDPYTLWVRTGARGMIQVCGSVPGWGCGAADVPAGPHAPRR